MQVVCPVCAYTNQVVDSYRPGSILSCRCGEHLQFVQDGVAPRVVKAGASSTPDASATPSSRLGKAG